MKHLLKVILLLLALMLPSTALAHDFEVDGIYYNRNGNKATVTYRGSSYDSYSNEYSGDVVIPTTVTYNGTTYSITSIGNYAFRGCSGLTNANIPNSVTSIGDYAFYGCSGLTSVNIPNSLTSIGYAAFYGCSGLTSVNIPNSLTSIGYAAFYGCSGLTSVNIPNSLTSIGSYTFYGCSGLTSVTIPNSLTSIGSYTFYGCSGLTSVTIPNSVTSIGGSAFYDCSGLTSVSIGNSVTTIGSYAFDGCSGLTSIIIPNSVTSIGSYAFSNCRGLTNVNIPESVTLIGGGAFLNCKDLSSVTIMNLEAWCNITFSGQASNPLNYAHHLYLNEEEVKDLIIPNSITAIGDYVFEGCYGLTSVNIHNSVTSIGNHAFNDCHYLTSTIIPNSVTTIGDYAFCECGLTNLIIPESVISIGNSAFEYCYLNRLIWNAVNCNSVGDWAFSSSSPNEIHFGNSVEHIPDGLPYLNMSGKKLVLPNSIKTIDTGAFEGSCGSVVIGDSIENITAATFSNGFNVAYVSTVNPQPCESGAFANPQTLYVPVGSRLNYFTSQGWSEFANIIEGTYVRATSITLNQSTAMIPKGVTQQLTATILPTNTSTQVATWFSNNTQVATVNSSGKVTAIGVGETDIVAYVDNEIAICHVTVTPVLVESLTLSDTQLTLEPNDMYTLTATVLPTIAENQTLEWIIPENDVILTQVVNNTRLNIGAIGTGSVTITVRTTDGSNLSATCTVNVQVLATSIALNMTSAEMTEGGILQLIATVLPTNATNRNVTWASSNSSVATVNNDGMVTAIAHGNVTITATTTDGTNLSASCAVTVNQNIIYASSIVLNYNEAELIQGESLQLEANILPANATNKTVTWSTSNGSVATVNSNGLVTAIAHGNATITATTTDGSNLSTSCSIIVQDPYNHDNYLSMNDTTVFHGSTFVIPVAMTNSESIISFQTDIFMPEGLEIVQEDGDYLIEPSDRMTRTHSLISNSVSNGAIRVLCYSSNYKPFTGNSGDDLFYITVKAADDAAGDYTIQLKNTLLTNTDFVDLAAPDVTATIHVMGYMLGDANNSGTVTVTDVVVTSQYVLELNPQPFNFEAADVNTDGNITVTDISRIAYMVLHPMMNVPLRAPAQWNHIDRMSGNDFTLADGETHRVSILLDNEMEYSAFQFDMTLPDGLTANNFALTDRAGSHAFDVNTLTNGKTRILCYSPMLTAISGNGGAILTFDVTTSGAVTGDIHVDDIELVTTDCQTMVLDDFTIGLNTATGIDVVTNGKTIARIDYYNIAGQRIDKPESGVTLVVTSYTDGTCSVDKVFKK